MNNEKISEVLPEGAFVIQSAVYWIQADDFPKAKEFKINSVRIEDTNWGKKAIFGLSDTENTEFQISSWNLAMKEKTIMNDSIIGKWIILEPFNQKKLKMSFKK